MLRRFVANWRRRSVCCLLILIALHAVPGQLSALVVENLSQSSAVFYSSSARTSYSMASGDLNGDGTDDLIIGDGYNSFRRPGIVYVYLGRNIIPNFIDLHNSSDLIIYGVNGYYGDISSLATGDVNGDDLNDIIIGMGGGGSPRGSGVVYVYLGRDTLCAVPTPQEISFAEADLMLLGVETFHEAGSSVASGDVNGDGFDDIIIGAPGEGYFFSPPGSWQGICVPGEGYDKYSISTSTD